MKNYFFAFFLVVTACASNPLKMSKIPRNVDHTALEMMAFKKKCLSKKLAIPVRRENCINFMHGPAAFVPDVAVINSMCDMNGIACKKNGNPLGKGSIELKEDSKTYSDLFEFKNPNGSIDNYEISILDQL